MIWCSECTQMLIASVQGMVWKNLQSRINSCTQLLWKESEREWSGELTIQPLKHWKRSSTQKPQPGPKSADQHGLLGLSAPSSNAHNKCHLWEIFQSPPRTVEHTWGAQCPRHPRTTSQYCITIYHQHYTDRMHMKPVANDFISEHKSHISVFVKFYTFRSSQYY